MGTLISKLQYAYCISPKRCSYKIEGIFKLTFSQVFASLPNTLRLRLRRQPCMWPRPQDKIDLILILYQKADPVFFHYVP